MEGSVDDRRPFVDPAVLEILRGELEPDSEYCVVFVNNYIQQLPRRLDRLRQAVETMDLGSAMDAVLSVKTSSQMVGAEYLWSLADELESALRRLNAHPRLEAQELGRLELSLLASMDACSGQTVAGLSAVAAA